MEIYVIDSEINILGVFSTYESIVWTDKLQEPGTFKATLIFSDQLNRILTRGNLLYKTDEEQPGLITRKYLKLNKYGQQTIVIQGYMASRYLKQRIIWNKMVMKGTPEQLMRQMVNEQVINPTNPDRKMSRVELGELQTSGGIVIEKQVTYDNLQDALTDVAKTANLGYRLRLDYARKKFVFEVIQGIDRSVGTETPCIFDRRFGNVYTQEYSEDDSNYKNVCLVGGPGQDDSRILATVGEAAELERYELFYSAANISSKDITTAELTSQLQQKGKEKLASNYVTAAFESKINQDKAMTYALGDTVTCMDVSWGVAVNTQVKAIQKGFSKTEKSVVVTFGDDAPTLVDLIKAKE